MATLHHRHWILALLAILAANGCCGENNQEVVDCPIDKVGPSQTVALVQNAVGRDGTLLYTGATPGLGLPSRCINRLESFRIFGSTVPVKFALGGNPGDPDTCSTSSVRLTPFSHETSTTAEVNQAFGEDHPKLPIQFIACIEAGGTPLAGITLVVIYKSVSS